MISLLEISFLNKELRDICQTSALAEASYGNACAYALRRRIADLLAVDSYVDLPLGNPRLTNINDVDCLIISLCDGFFLQFLSGHSHPILSANGTVDWKKVFRIKLVSIGKE